MTSKERFRAAFTHEAVDRIPLMEQSVASTVATELLGREAFTGTTDLHHDLAEAALRGDDEYEKLIQRVLEDNVALADLLGHSAVSVPWIIPKPTRRLDDGDYLFGDPEKGAWNVRRFDAESRTFGIVRRGGEPTTEAELEKALDERETALRDYAPQPEEFRFQARLREMVGERMDVVGIGGIQIPLEPFWLEMVALRPDLVARHLELSAEALCRSIEFQAAMGFKVIWGGYDLADNRGPIYGPRVFRELVLPPLRRITDRCRELGIFFLYRTDGNLWSIAEEFFVASGIHAYGEIDIDAGMDLVEIRRRYPRVTMWGGISCGGLLRRGTADEVRHEVRRVIKGVGMRGLVFGCSNSILHGTPAENVLAMTDEVNRMSMERAVR